MSDADADAAAAFDAMRVASTDPGTSSASQLDAPTIPLGQAFGDLSASAPVPMSDEQKQTAPVPPRPVPPKKPPTAYFLFMAEKRAELTAAAASSASTGEGVGSVAQVAKIIAAAWAELSPEDKEKYTEGAAAAKQKYEADLAEYNLKMIERRASGINDDSAGADLSGDVASLILPLSRIKRIMTSDDEVKAVAKQAQQLVAVATEAYLRLLGRSMALHAAKTNRHTVRPDFFPAVLRANPGLSFLSHCDFLTNVPAGPVGRAGSKAASAATADDEEEQEQEDEGEVVPKRKAILEAFSSLADGTAGGFALGGDYFDDPFPARASAGASRGKKPKGKGKITDDGDSIDINSDNDDEDEKPSSSKKSRSIRANSDDEGVDGDAASKKKGSKKSSRGLTSVSIAKAAAGAGAGAGAGQASILNMLARKQAASAAGAGAGEGEDGDDAAARERMEAFLRAGDEADAARRAAKQAKSAGKASGKGAKGKGRGKRSSIAGDSDDDMIEGVDYRMEGGKRVLLHQDDMDLASGATGAGAGAGAGSRDSDSDDAGARARRKKARFDDDDDDEEEEEEEDEDIGASNGLRRRRAPGASRGLTDSLSALKASTAAAKSKAKTQGSGWLAGKKGDRKGLGSDDDDDDDDDDGAKKKQAKGKKSRVVLSSSDDDDGDAPAPRARDLSSSDSGSGSESDGPLVRRKAGAGSFQDKVAASMAAFMFKQG